jgi:putative endonuclease
VLRLLVRLRGWWHRWRKPLTLGERGEVWAARYLKRIGYHLVARSERGGLGEIDLVAIDGRTVVFVEVKTRRSHETGHPADAVDHNKQRRLTRLALSWLKRHDLLENAARFDVVAITWSDDASDPRVEHFRNAFEPQGNWQMFS